jgi:predicted DNA-binding transcriptional regulator YafY
VRPVAFLFHGTAWMTVAWRALRQDFRSFRLDRMGRIDITDARFKPEPGKTLPDDLNRPDNTGKLKL